MTGEEKEEKYHDELCLDQQQFFVVVLFIVSVDEILRKETRLLLKQLSLFAPTLQETGTNLSPQYLMARFDPA